MPVLKVLAGLGAYLRCRLRMEADDIDGIDQADGARGPAQAGPCHTAGKSVEIEMARVRTVLTDIERGHALAELTGKDGRSDREP